MHRELKCLTLLKNNFLKNFAHFFFYKNFVHFNLDEVCYFYVDIQFHTLDKLKYYLLKCLQNI